MQASARPFRKKEHLMFVRTLQPFGKSLSRPATRQRRAKALTLAGPRPQIERLEDRTLLSAASQALVGQMYQDLLQRPADAGGLANWTAALDHNASPSQVALDLAESPEARALQVQSLYQQFLHRAADPAGLAGFTQALAAGQTLEQVAAAIVTSPEYSQNRGGGSDSGFLNALYQDALNRPIDSGGAASFGQALAGNTPRAQVAAAIFASTELQQDIVQRDYQYFLRRAADAAGLANWTQALQHGMRDEQVAAAIAGSAEYTQIVQNGGGSLQQTLLPTPPLFSLPVTVVNTPSQPVPTAAQGTTAVTGNVGITGTPNVNIANSPTVQAQQSGPWTVGISGTPNVQVVSSLSNPVFVRDVNDAAQPFRAELFARFPASSVTFTVPTGKRLVVEDLSAEISVSTGTRAELLGDIFVSSGLETRFFIPTTLGISTSRGDDLLTNQVVKFSADPGATVTFFTPFTDGGVVQSIDVSIYGYLVNVP
jgi:hypothetical protein